MKARELAKLLIRKAGQDEFVILKLIADPVSPDEIIGFHAQQAVKKLLKAVLAHNESRSAAPMTSWNSSTSSRTTASRCPTSSRRSTG